jgi:DNA helicase-2/ATP-dependent DNA helicase PcrA
LSGKIDLLRIVDDAYHVIDWKTGRAYENWEGPKMSDDDKLKLHRYTQQLLFYKILLEGSAHYRRPVKELALEFVEGVVEKREPITLLYHLEDGEVARAKALISAVYKKIVTLDFPDTSKYSNDLAGVLQFEEDLISWG